LVEGTNGDMDPLTAGTSTRIADNAVRMLQEVMLGDLLTNLLERGIKFSIAKKWMQKNPTAEFATEDEVIELLRRSGESEASKNGHTRRSKKERQRSEKKKQQRKIRNKLRELFPNKKVTAYLRKNKPIDCQRAANALLDATMSQQSITTIETKRVKAERAAARRRRQKSRRMALNRRQKQQEMYNLRVEKDRIQKNERRLKGQTAKAAACAEEQKKYFEYIQETRARLGREEEKARCLATKRKAEAEDRKLIDNQCAEMTKRVLTQANVAKETWEREYLLYMVMSSEGCFEEWNKSQRSKIQAQMWITIQTTAEARILVRAQETANLAKRILSSNNISDERRKELNKTMERAKELDAKAPEILLKVALRESKVHGWAVADTIAQALVQVAASKVEAANTLVAKLHSAGRSNGGCEPRPL